LTITNKGVITGAGKLADGTAYTASGILLNSTAAGTDSQYLLFLETSKYVVSGAITHNSLGDCAGTLTWTKNAPTSHYYPSINTTLSVKGSTYVSPASTDFSSDSDNASFTIYSGILADAIPSEPVTVTENKIVDSGNNPGLKLRTAINKTTGVLTGSFVDPASKKRIEFGGAFVQDKGNGASSAAGFFLTPLSGGSGLSGNFGLLPNP
jgi:hypothetical protein